MHICIDMVNLTIFFAKDKEWKNEGLSTYLMLASCSRTLCRLRWSLWVQGQNRHARGLIRNQLKNICCFLQSEERGVGLRVGNHRLLKHQGGERRVEVESLPQGFDCVLFGNISSVVWQETVIR